MPFYTVESIQERTSEPIFEEKRTVWIAGMPKGVNAAPGLETVRFLTQVVKAFNAQASTPVRIIENPDAWYSKKLAIEASESAAGALGNSPGVAVKPLNYRLPSPDDGFK